MKYASIAGVDKPVSRIFFGTAIAPMSRGKDCCSLLDAVYGTGVTAFDTARVYGRAEDSFGQWIRTRNNREQIVLLTKCAHPNLLTGKKRVTERDIRKDFEISAKKLGTDYFDIYLLHRDDPQVPAGQIVELMNQLHREGKIKAFGGSNWTHQRIREANEYAAAHGLIPFTVSSPHFSLARQIYPTAPGCLTLTGPENSEARSFYAQSGIAVVPYASLGNGMLSGKLRSEHRADAARYLSRMTLRSFACEDNYVRLARCEDLAARKGCAVSQIALAWMLRQEMDVFPIVSTTRGSRMAENAGCCQIGLTQEECDWLDLAPEHGSL